MAWEFSVLVVANVTASSHELLAARGERAEQVVAVMEAWDPMKFDEILVSTLPTGSSRWVEANLPRRLEKLTSVTVRHVISTPKTEPRTSPAPKHETHGVLSPLAAALTRR